jgi:DNA-directed RNA polymerase sigma subunit (sigma70/sigma32)
MSINTHADVVTALLAGRDSQRGSTSKKTSRSSRRKPKCSGNSTKPTKAVALNRNGGLIRNHKEDCTDADNRLREFMQGLRSTRLLNSDKEEVEHWYDPQSEKNYTLQEIADVMGVSRERVRQIEETALRKLWRYISIMNKREGVSEDEMFQQINECKESNDTIYMP